MILITVLHILSCSYLIWTFFEFKKTVYFIQFKKMYYFKNWGEGGSEDSYKFLSCLNFPIYFFKTFLKMVSNVIETLNSHSYATWALDMKYLMLKMGIWELRKFYLYQKLVIRCALRVRQNQTPFLIYMKYWNWILTYCRWKQQPSRNMELIEK